MMNPSHGNGLSGSRVGEIAAVVVDKFPAGLRVLVVDDDPTCLMILERMLRSCLYEVTKCNRAEMALSLLRKNKNGFDIVISDVHMPDMDGFKLLEHIGLEMDLPVIMMSADDSKSVVFKGVTHGAVDYLIKPVRMEALKNIWQHVVRKMRSEWSAPEQSGSIEESGERPQQQRGGSAAVSVGDEADDNSSSVNEGNWRSSNGSRKRKDEESDEQGDDKEDSSNLKKPRVVWSVELHQQFVAAVNQLGVEKAVPKKILELMNVPGLTRENVASHLQKYRIYLRRLGGVSQHQGNLSNSFMTGQDASFTHLSSLNGFDLQTLAVTGQLPAQSLAQLQGLSRPVVSKPGIQVSPIVDERSIFSFDNPKMRFGDGHRQPPLPQMNLLHGIPTSMEPKHLIPGLQQQQQQQSNRMSIQQQIAAVRAGQSVQNTGLMMPLPSQQPRGSQMINSQSGLRQQQMVPNRIPERNCYSGTVTGRINIPESSRVLPTSYSVATTSAFNNNLPCEIPVNRFPIASTPGLSSAPIPRPPVSYQEEVNSSDTGFATSSYNMFTNPQQRNNDWDLRSIGLVFDAQPDAESAAFSASEAYSSSSLPRNRSDANTVTVPSHSRNQQPPQVPLQHHMNQTYDNGSSRVKPERSACPPSTMFQEQFNNNNQEDLMSALLKQEGIGGPVDTEFDFDAYSIDNISV